MALALPTVSALSGVMPQSLSTTASDPDCHIVVSTTPPSLDRYRDSYFFNERSPPLSPAESDNDTPLSPITFLRNEDYERARLSYIAPVPRPSSSPSSPSGALNLSPVSPVIFSQQNLSSPSITLQPLPVFPTAGTQSLALRLKRPLPPLPKVDTTNSSSAAAPRLRQDTVAAHVGARRSSSSSEEPDFDSVTIFSPAASSYKSQSPATSIFTSASSDSAGSSKAVGAFPAVHTKPIVQPLTIPVRSHSSPLPHSAMPPIGMHIISPCISVTPASPLPPQQFTFTPRPKKRTASAASIVLASPYDQLEYSKDPEPQIPRATSPAPSITPSISSIKSFQKEGKFTLKRIASKTRLFGRRTLSSASEPTWGSDSGDETVTGHEHTGSLSLDDKLLRPRERARSDSPSTLGSGSRGKRSVDDQSMRSLRDTLPEHRTPKRLEIMELTLTPYGDVWEERELHDVIPKLRQLKAPSRIKM